MWWTDKPDRTRTAFNSVRECLFSLCLMQAPVSYLSPYILLSCPCPFLLPHSYCPSLCRPKWMCRQQRRLLPHLQGPENWLWLRLSLRLQTPGQKDLWRYRKKNLWQTYCAEENDWCQSQHVGGRTNLTWTSFFVVLLWRAVRETWKSEGN